VRLPQLSGFSWILYIALAGYGLAQVGHREMQLRPDSAWIVPRCKDINILQIFTDESSGTSCEIHFNGLEYDWN
jgi:hypothetical protein